MDDQKQIEDLVDLLDRFVSTGGGHMNVVAEKDPHNNQVSEKNKEALDGTLSVKTYRSLDCSLGNLACNVPTLDRDIDNKEEQ